MGNAGKGTEECMASFCEFELGYGHVAIQMVSRDNPAKFKEQYEVHVSDRLFLNLFLCANSKAFLAQWPVPLGSQEILKKLTLYKTLDIRTQITGTASGTSWSTTSRDTTLGVKTVAYVNKNKYYKKNNSICTGSSLQHGADPSIQVAEA